MELTLPGRLQKSDLAALREVCNDLVAVQKNDTHLFCTRKGGKKFQYRSIQALGKLLPTINPADIQLVRTPYSDRLPDTFFRNHLDPYKPLDEQVMFAKGRFADFSQILANIKSDVKKKRNLAVKSSVETKGVIGTYNEGLITAAEVKTNMAVQALIEEKKEAEENKVKDLPGGKRWGFICHKTGKRHDIVSHKDDTKADVTSAIPVDSAMDQDGSVLVTAVKEPPVKKKHYYFYSPAGYGKTLMLSTVFSQMCNVTTVSDPNNFVGARSDAQFLVIDEYGVNKRLTMEGLKSLTSGNPKYSFAGNRKSHGASFVPRNDVQVIILSNHHLFYCMGKGKDREISRVNAGALRDRFHIIKMNEGEDGASTELEDAEKFTEAEEEKNPLDFSLPYPFARGWAQ